MEKTAQVCSAIQEEVKKIIVGKEEQTKLILAAMLAKGHVLLEDMPGTGKTTLVKTLSKTLGFDFRRIQFTPDLLPSDVTGMNVFQRETNRFVYLPGPVHTHLLLADEINRAIPRTQAALLESMEERQVTIDGESKPLPEPFFVLATQNPVESESTFALPQAQMDRFMIQISMGYPSAEEEAQMMKQLSTGILFDQIVAVTDAEEFCRLQKEIENVELSDMLVDYIVALVQKTRERQGIRLGASPRASLALARMAKAYAAMQGRHFVTPDDIKSCAVPVLAHRILLTGSAKLMGNNAAETIEAILQETAVPPGKEAMLNER